MILFFETPDKSIIAAGTTATISPTDVEKLVWLFNGATLLNKDTLSGTFVGPRREMVTPWSTNAVEITQNMGVAGISRIEEFFPVSGEGATYDKMLQKVYTGLGQQLYTIDRKPEPVIGIENISEYNTKEGLALNAEEIEYLEGLARELGRKLTDSEVFGFSQVNSEIGRASWWARV